MVGKLLVDLFVAALTFLARKMRVLNQKHLRGWDGSIVFIVIFARVCIPKKKMHDYYDCFST